MAKEKILIAKTIQKYDFVYRWSGINIESSKRARRENLKYTFIYLLNMLQIFRETACVIYFFRDGIASPQAFEYFAFATPGTIMLVLAQVKSVWFLVYDKDVNKLMRTLKDLEREENFREGDFKRDKIIKKEKHFLHNLLKSYSALNLLLAVTLPLTPLVETIVYYSKTKEVLLRLPFVTVCPANAADDYKMWLFVFVGHTWAGTVNLLAICGTDFFFYVSCIYIRIQYRLLQYEFERVIEPNVTNEKFYCNVQFNAKLRKLIQWHQDLTSLTESLEKLYAKSNLFNLISSSVIICLVGFNIMTVQDTSKSVYFFSFLFTCLLQFLLMCFFGEMLKTASMDVSNSVYNSRWFLAETSIKRSLLIIMIRAERPCKVTAFGFVDMDLKLFITVLSTSWSYLALLNNVYNSNEDFKNN